MNRILLSAGIFTAMLLPLSAFAACSTPVGSAGTAFYNTTVNAVQFCDGDDWYNTGLIAPSATGTSCNSPTGSEGTAFYNTTQNTMQFCNGDGWVNMGTMNFPSATGTSCTVPTGPEGSMFFNTTTKTMQFCNGDDWVNATYLYVAASVFTETAKIKGDLGTSFVFGASVSIDGDYALVGAGREGAGGTQMGAAYVFKRSGTSWIKEAKLEASDKQTGDKLGYAVSISGIYAVAAAQQEDTGGVDAGSAYVFKRTGTSWAQEAKIQASDRQSGDSFGVSISVDGDYMVVGAHTEDSGGADAGSAYIFKRTGTSWSQQAKIQASDRQAGDIFGYPVAISGDYVIVGSSGEDTGGSWAGAAYIYKRTGTSWAQEAKIQALDKENGDQFGRSVFINGAYAIIASPKEDQGGSNAGAAYIFKRTGTSWTQEAKLLSDDLEAGDSLGTSVSIHGDYAVVGAKGEVTDGIRGGAVYVFKRNGSTWSQIDKIQASDVQENASFGHSVSIDNQRILVGGTGVDSAGAAYIFD